jgi:hypothetical protein
MGMGYKGLFWVDGSSCVIAILIFALLVKEKKNHCESYVLEVASVFKDKISGSFCSLVCNCYDFLSVVYDFTSVPQ